MSPYLTQSMSSSNVPEFSCNFFLKNLLLESLEILGPLLFFQSLSPISPQSHNGLPVVPALKPFFWPRPLPFGGPLWLSSHATLSLNRGPAWIRSTTALPTEPRGRLTCFLLCIHLHYSVCCFCSVSHIPKPPDCLFLVPAYMLVVPCLGSDFWQTLQSPWVHTSHSLWIPPTFRIFL